MFNVEIDSICRVKRKLEGKLVMIEKQEISKSKKYKLKSDFWKNSSSGKESKSQIMFLQKQLIQLQRAIELIDITIINLN